MFWWRYLPLMRNALIFWKLHTLTFAQDTNVWTLMLSKLKKFGKKTNEHVYHPSVDSGLWTHDTTGSCNFHIFWKSIFNIHPPRPLIKKHTWRMLMWQLSSITNDKNAELTFDDGRVLNKFWMKIWMRSQISFLYSRKNMFSLLSQNSNGWKYTLLNYTVILKKQYIVNHQLEVMCLRKLVLHSLLTLYIKSPG